jgi:aspartokinase
VACADLLDAGCDLPVVNERHAQIATSLGERRTERDRLAIGRDRFGEESLRAKGDPEVVVEVGIGCVDADPRAFGRAISAIGAIPLRMVSQAASRRNITFVLRDADVPTAMTRLHDEFFG